MDGVIVIDKPSGPTSHDIVACVKRIFKAKKAGHAGTLDPLASGVLIICLNSATKDQDSYMSDDKEYETVILFGVETTTQDIEGEVVQERALPADFESLLRSAIPEFTGCILQKPPHFSAVKFKGKPLYKWAREGRPIDVPPREVEIKSFEIVGISGAEVRAKIACSKGTYVRSLCHDLGEKIGCGACVKALRRTASGRFHINQAVSLETLYKNDDPSQYLISIS